jgi:nuclear transcription factor Y gamma
MKSEEFIYQEMEKERQQKAMEEGSNTDVDKPMMKFMISGEAPVLMSKACELLIKDLSFRAWRHTERNRRRTLQRQDLHAAVGESEVYDFLIDIVPRVTTPKTSVPGSVDAAAAAAAAAMTPPLPPGIPMGGIPTGLPTVPPPMNAPPAVGQPMPGGMDTNMMQQMQPQHHPGQQQQHAQPGMMQHQYADPQQQHHYQYMGMAPAPTTDMNQNATTQQQQVQQWSSHPVPDSGSTPQTS